MCNTLECGFIQYIKFIWVSASVVKNLQQFIFGRRFCSYMYIFRRLKAGRAAAVGGRWRWVAKQLTDVHFK